MGRFPHARTVTLLALTDAITGMIGILLVVLVLARPPAEEERRLQQSDQIVTCIPVIPPGSNARKATLIKLDSHEDPILLTDFLRKLWAEGAMEVRLSIRRISWSSTDDACLEKLKKEVERLNRSYEENNTTLPTPYVFLTVFFDQDTEVGEK